MIGLRGLCRGDSAGLKSEIFEKNKMQLVEKGAFIKCVGYASACDGDGCK